jgi:predicted RNase H-like HicB family nuclease
MKFTAIIEKGENGWFVGQVKELPAAVSQGKTVEELKENHVDALNLLLGTNKGITEKEYSGRITIKEELELI